MPEYLSPGVYVEEIDAGPKPIEGVSTSTAGAVGVTLRGPTRGRRGPFTGKPELVTSFAEFVRKFGGYIPEPPAADVNRWTFNANEGGRWWHFPLAVKGFFDNGGQRLYVKRVFSKEAKPAQAVLGEGIISEITQDAAATDTTLRVRHLIGVSVGKSVKVFVNGFSVGDFAVTAYHGTESVTLANPIGQELRRGRDFIAIEARQAVAAAAPDPRLQVIAKSEGDWGGNEESADGLSAGNGLSVRIRPVVGATLKIMSMPTAGGSVATTLAAAPGAGASRITLANATGFSNGDRVSINGTEHTLNPPTTTLSNGATAGDTTITVVSAANLSNDARVDIAGTRYTLSNVDATANTCVISPALTANAATGTVVRLIRPLTSLSSNATLGAPSISVVSAAELSDGAQVDIAATTYTLSNVNVTANTCDIAPALAADAATGTGVHALVLVPIAPEFDISPSVPGGATWAVGTAIQKMRQANTAPGKTINVRGASQLYPGALVELDNGIEKEVMTVESVVGNTVTLSADLANQYYEEHRLRVIEADVGVRYRKHNEVAAEELFTNLRLIDDGSANYIVTHVNERSALIDLRAGDGFEPETLAKFPSVAPATGSNPERFWMDLTGGRDNLNLLSVDDFVGEDDGAANRTGIQAFEDIDEISICLAPGMWSSTVHSALIQHCEILKDRFAILDPQFDLSVEGIRDFREPLDTKYAALYYPWIEVRDPSTKRNVDIGPSGHLAGIYARVDVERGVHKAPANEVIRGITKIAQDVTKREQDLLNPKNINVLRFFPGRGNRVWGARVATSDSAWKYINVRRLFIFVEESIDEGTQWVVFEPNDEPLWARVRQTITNFLTTVWRSGALQGLKSDEAFFVKCDRTTMTQEDIDNGRLICVIGIAPVKPAEFVIFRIQQKTQSEAR